MTKADSVKLKRKKIKADLIEVIEKTLYTQASDGKALRRLKKTVKKSAEKILKKFLKGIKKEINIESDSKAEEIKPLALTKRNRTLSKKIKGKPGKENIKEIIKI